MKGNITAKNIKYKANQPHYVNLCRPPANLVQGHAAVRIIKHNLKKRKIVMPEASFQNETVEANSMKEWLCSHKTYIRRERNNSNLIRASPPFLGKSIMQMMAFHRLNHPTRLH